VLRWTRSILTDLDQQLRQRGHGQFAKTVDDVDDRGAQAIICVLPCEPVKLLDGALPAKGPTRGTLEVVLLA